MFGCSDLGRQYTESRKINLVNILSREYWNSMYLEFKSICIILHFVVFRRRKVFIGINFNFNLNILLALKSLLDFQPTYTEDTELLCQKCSGSINTPVLIFWPENPYLCHDIGNESMYCKKIWFLQFYWWIICWHGQSITVNAPYCFLGGSKNANHTFWRHRVCVKVTLHH